MVGAPASSGGGSTSRPRLMPRSTERSQQRAAGASQPPAAGQSLEGHLGAALLQLRRMGEALTVMEDGGSSHSALSVLNAAAEEEEEEEEVVYYVTRDVTQQEEEPAPEENAAAEEEEEEEVVYCFVDAMSDSEFLTMLARAAARELVDAMSDSEFLPGGYWARWPSQPPAAGEAAASEATAGPGQPPAANGEAAARRGRPAMAGPAAGGRVASEPAVPTAWAAAAVPAEEASGSQPLAAAAEGDAGGMASEPAVPTAWATLGFSRPRQRPGAVQRPYRALAAAEETRRRYHQPDTPAAPRDGERPVMLPIPGLEGRAGRCVWRLEHWDLGAPPQGPPAPKYWHSGWGWQAWMD